VNYLAAANDDDDAEEKGAKITRKTDCWVGVFGEMKSPPADSFIS